MNRTCVALLAGIAALTCAAAPADTASPKFDGRAWTVGNHQETRAQILTEYVLPGQTVDSWKELVTSTIYIDRKHVVPLAGFVASIRHSMEKDCPSLVWNDVHQDDKTAIFEWHDSGCGGFPPQHELDRIALGPQGAYRLAYSIYPDRAKDALTPEKRNAWLAILGKTPLVEVTADSSVASDAPSAPAPTVPSKQTQALAAAVVRSGQLCQAGIRSEMVESKSGVAHWRLECSGNQKYTVLVDPSGATTVFRTAD